MRILKSAIVFLLAAVVALTTIEAQITVLPADGEPIQFPNSRQTKTGTGRIKGRLVTADTGAPVRRAQVRLTGSEILPKTATTDLEGTYEFRDLPPGRFTINASKSGYVSVGYGQTRPFESPRPIELTDGQAIDKADITMPRGSAIAGRIVDEFGEPVADAVVSAMRSTWSDGRRRLQPTGRTATTNDLGQYRVYGLPPGEYFVTATLRGGQEMMVMEMAVAAVRATVAEPPDAPRSGYAPTYYPGTANGNEAQKLTLALGQEAMNADFGLVPVRLARITGVVIGSDGRPAEGVMVSAMPRNTAVGGIRFPAGGSARTDRNGNFTLNGIAPGEYTLNARGVTIVQSGGDGDRQMFTMTRIVAGGEGGSESGSVPISVTGEDLANVVIATSKGTTASGRVIYEGGAKPTANTLRISAPAIDADNPLMAFGSSSSVTAEGTFELKGLAGPRLIRVSNVPAGWTLKAVRVNNTDITDTGLDIRPSEPITGLEVVLTNRTTEVNGGVKAGNEPASDYTVVIFSEDPQKWLAPMPRHIASARPNQSGRFQVKGLPTGNYYAIAVEYIPQGDWNDPEVLDRLKTRATRFTLDEGEVKMIDLALESM
jgi:protocatechuate 3,4-dioxygenase beta subunit